MPARPRRGGTCAAACVLAVAVAGSGLGGALAQRQLAPQMELRRFLMSAPKPGLRADPGTRFQPVPFDEVGGKSGGSNGLLHDLANPNDSPGPFSPGGPSTPENEDGVMSGNPGVIGARPHWPELGGKLGGHAANPNDSPGP